MDLQQVLSALENADAAGDTQSAQELANLAKSLMSGQVTPIPAAPAEGAFSAGFKAYLPNLQESYGSAKLLAGVGAQRLLGEGDVSKSLIESGAQSIKEAKAKQEPLSTPERTSFGDALDKGIGSVLTEWLPYQAGSGAANVLESLAIAGAGSMVGSAAPGIGTVAGGATGLLAKEVAKRGIKEAAEKILAQQGEKAASDFFLDQTKKAAVDVSKKIATSTGLAGMAAVRGAGEVTGRAVEEAEKTGGTAYDIELARVIPAATVHAVAEFISDKIGLGALEGLGKEGKNYLYNIGKNILVTGTKESPTEIVQTAAERYGANLSLSDAQAIKEYADAVAASYAMSTTPGAVGGVRETMAARAKTDVTPQIKPEAKPEITPPITEPTYQPVPSLTGTDIATLLEEQAKGTAGADLLAGARERTPDLYRPEPSATGADMAAMLQGTPTAGEDLLTASREWQAEQERIQQEQDRIEQEQIAAEAEQQRLEQERTRAMPGFMGSDLTNVQLLQAQREAQKKQEADAEKAQKAEIKRILSTTYSADPLQNFRQQQAAIELIENKKPTEVATQEPFVAEAPVATHLETFPDAEKTKPTVAEQAPKVELQGREIPVGLSKIDEKSGNVLVDMNTAKTDESWKRGDKTETMYIGPGGTENAIRDRYARFGEFAKTANKIDAPFVNVDEDGNVSFGDGRHRFAFMRDQGIGNIPVAMSPESRANAVKNNLISDIAPQQTQESVNAKSLVGQPTYVAGSVVEVPVANLKLSQDVPQFKSDANKSGVVESSKLEGKFDRRLASPIQVWQRTNGDMEVISGRHRLDLAQRNGEKTIPAQIHREADGFNADMARMLDIELNVKDGRGKVKDYVSFFKEFGLTKQQAKNEGLLNTAVGRQAYEIADAGSPSLIAAHNNKEISDDAATAIAINAPKDEALQNLGMQQVQNGKPINHAVNFMRSAMAAGFKGQEGNVDLFGFDDSFAKEAEAVTKEATKQQREARQQLSAIKGAAKSPEKARLGGVDVRNLEQTQAKIADLEKTISELENFHTNPELYKKLRQSAGLETTSKTAEEVIEAPEVSADQRAMFSLRGKTAEQVSAFEQSIRTLLNKFGLKEIGLKLSEGMRDEGSYAAKLIQIAADSANPIRTLRHEAIHALRELGFFTDAQWNSLSKMAKDKWIDQYLKQRNIDGKPLKAGEESRYDAYMREYKGDMEKITEEAVADAFADFDATKAPAGMLQAILQKLRNLFQSIKTALTKVEAPEKIFGKVEKGELKPEAQRVATESKSLRDKATENFKRWFKDSKVVDENGEPLVVYHGSKLGIITEFGFEQRHFTDPVFHEEPAAPVGSQYRKEGWGHITQIDKSAQDNKPFTTGEFFRVPDSDEVIFKSADGQIEVFNSKTFKKQVKEFMNPRRPISDRVAGGVRAIFFAEDPIYTNLYSSWGWHNWENNYTDDGQSYHPTTYPVYLSIQNPVTGDDWEVFKPYYEKHTRGDPEKMKTAEELFRNERWEAREGYPDFVKYAKSKGYDGYALIEGGASAMMGLESSEKAPGGKRTWAVFDPRQIKSAIGNNGEYSLTDADIRKSLRSTAEKTKEKAQQLLQKRAPINVEALSDVDPEYVARLGRVFNPQSKTIIDKIEGMKDGFWRRAAQGLADQYRTIKDYDMRSYMLARMSKTQDGALEGLMFSGHVFNDGGALNIKKNTKGLMEALKPVGNETDRYMMWIALNREANLPEGKRSPEISALVADKDQLTQGTLNGKPRLEVYKSVQKDMNALNKSVLDVALDMGLINSSKREIAELESRTDISEKKKAERIAYLQEHPGAYERFTSDLFYIPFYKQMEDGDIESAVSSAGLTSQKFSAELKGMSDKPFADLMENTLRNWSHILSASMKNQAANSTINATMKAGATIPNMKAGLAYEDGKVVSTKTGEVVGDGKLRPEYTESGKGMVKIMQDGQPMYFEVLDPMLLDSITSIGYMGPKSKFLDVARDFKNMLQFGVTVSPIFKTNNLIRDSIGAMAISDLKKNPFANVIEGWGLAGKNNPAHIEALAGGAIFNFGSTYEGDQAKLVRRLLKQGVKEEHILDTKDKIEAGLKNLWEKYEELGNKSEAANRLALYKQLRDKGMSHLEASFQARDLMDFSMQGSWPAFRTVTMVVPFLNARVQGLYKLGRDGIVPTSRVLYNTITGKPIDYTDQQKAYSFGLVTTSVSLASMALYLAFKDDEEFKKRDEWDRDNFWWIKLPNMDYALRVPKPFEIGAFGTMTERVLEQILDKGAEGKQFGDSLSRMLFDTFAMNPVPQMFKPLLDLYANKDSFTGAPIESAGMERLSKQERMTEQTSPLAKALGGMSQILGEKGELSPAQVDYAIKGYFGWLGSMAATTSMYATMPFKDGAYPDTNWMDKASLGLVRTLPAVQSKYSTAFYEANKEISQAFADMRHYAEIGDSEKVQKILEEKQDKIALNKLYDKTAKNMAKVRLQIRVVMNDTTMDGASKKEEVERLKQLISMMAEQAEEVRKSMK